MLIITGGFVYWFHCSLLSFFLFSKYVFIFNILYILITFFPFFFFLPFLMSHLADRVFVLQQGVRPEPLR